MKNLKVSSKLIVGFLVVVIMANIVGFMGIYGMSKINAADDDLYNYNVIAMDALGSIRENFASQRMMTRNLVVYQSGTTEFQNALSNLAALEADLNRYAEQYKPTMNTDEDKRIFNQILDLYQNDYQKVKEELKLYAGQNNTEQAMYVLDNTGAQVTGDIADLLMDAYNYNVAASKSAVEGNTSLFMRLMLIEVAVLLAAVGTAIFLAFYLARLISRPLATLTTFMNRAGTTGDIKPSQEDEENIRVFGQRRDETGQCIASTAKFVTRLSAVAGTLEAVAGGDLTVDLALLSEHDVMGASLKKMTANLNEMFGEINAASSQVSTGSTQIANGAQILAQGSTEQAAAVQQLSASIGEIAQKTKANAEIADQAAKLAGTIRQSAEKGSSQMDEMMDAVREINEASQSINKVIKVIDDIAFQTNILALNAAVEAARAGQHGKGFAVVAEEVRNLAAKSAEAAKDTGSLIANSMEKAALGARIAGETATSLGEIVSGINESSQIVGEIARSSIDQTEGINQISVGIDQVSQVVQQNSATAQQDAAASEEMSGQATLLQQLIAQFKLKDNGGFGRAARLGPPADFAAAAPAAPRPERQSFSDSASFGGFGGKY